MNTALRNFSFAVLAFVGAIECEGAGQEFSASLGWDSRYVSEGRNNLEEGGIASFEASTLWERWELGVVLSEADSVEYSERNWWVATSRQFAGLDMAASLAYLEFPEDGCHDTELGLNVSGLAFSELAFNADIVYSSEANGFFFEWSLEREYVLRDHFSVIPCVCLSANSGYVSGEPNGLNSWQLGLSFDPHISDRYSVALFLNASFGIADGVENIGWAGLRFGL